MLLSIPEPTSGRPWARFVRGRGKAQPQSGGRGLDIDAVSRSFGFMFGSMVTEAIDQRMYHLRFGRTKPGVNPFTGEELDRCGSDHLQAIASKFAGCGINEDPPFLGALVDLFQGFGREILDRVLTELAATQLNQEGGPYPTLPLRAPGERQLRV